MKQPHLRKLILALLLVTAFLFTACDGGVNETVVEPEPLEDGVIDEEPVITDEEPVITDEEPLATAEPVITEDQDVTGAEEMGAFGEFGVVGVDQGLMLATEFLDRSVDTNTGEDVGLIDDALIDLQTGNLLFVRVTHEGILGLQDDNVLIPLSAMQWDSVDEEFDLTVANDSFANWPEISPDFPDATDPTWDDDLTTFWEDAGVDIFWDPQSDMNTVAWLSNVVENDIGFDTEAGNVDDMLIDLSQGRAKYVVLSFDTGLFAEARRAIPFSAFDATLLDAGQVEIIPNIDVDTLTAAPALDENILTQEPLIDESFDDPFDQYWETEGYLVAGPNDELAATPTEDTTAGEDLTDDMVDETAAVTETTGLAGIPGLQADSMMLASTLIEREVENPAEEQLGFVDDILIDSATGNVLFALVEHGGFLDLGEEWVAVPLTAMELGPENDELILNVSEAAWDTYPGLGINNEWPLGLGDEWSTDVETFWNDTGFDTTVLEGVVADDVVRATNLLGIVVNTADATDLAVTTDMVVDMAQGNVDYVLLDPEAVDLVATEGDLLIPWDRFDFTTYDPTLEIDALTLTPDVDLPTLVDAPRVTTLDADTTGLLGADFNTVDSYWGTGDTALVDDEEAGIAGRTFGVTGADEGSMIFATALLDREVENAAEEQLGFIDDMLIERNSGNVLFALVEHGGFLDLGEERVAVPLTAMDLGPENDELILNVSEEVWETYPDSELDQDWPLGYGETWATDLMSFWNASDYDTTVLDGVVADDTVWLSDLVGLDVNSVDAEPLAATTDFIVNLQNGTVEYALIDSYDVTLAAADGALLVPWESLDFAFFDPASALETLAFDQDFDITLLNDAPRITGFGAEDEFLDLDFSAVDTYWDDAGFGAN